MPLLRQKIDKYQLSDILIKITIPLINQSTQITRHGRDEVNSL